MTLAAAKALDAADPLADWREKFMCPPGVIYLDGNSLGQLPVATVAAGADVLARQWGDRLIRSWNEGWIDAPTRVGAMIAPLIGAAADEVIVADSTSVNLRAQIRQTALRYRQSDLQRVSPPERIPLRQTSTPRQPQSQMPARRMPDHDRTAIRFQSELTTPSRKHIRRRRHIFICPRIAAPTVDPAIFDVPNPHPVRAQIVGDPVHDVALGNRGLPAPAVDHHHSRMRTRAFGSPHIDHLQRIRAIAHRRIGFRLHARKQIVPHHHIFFRHDFFRHGGRLATNRAQQKQYGRIFHPNSYNRPRRPYRVFRSRSNPDMRAVLSRCVFPFPTANHIG